MTWKHVSVVSVRFATEGIDEENSIYSLLQAVNDSESRQMLVHISKNHRVFFILCLSESLRVNQATYVWHISSFSFYFNLFYLFIFTCYRRQMANYAINHEI